MVTSDPKPLIDESPVTVSEITVDGQRLIAREPLRFEVTYDAEALVFDLEGPLDIYLFAETRELLIDILEDDLEIFWRDFAVGDQSRLSGDAQHLGAEMRRIFVEASDAA